MPSDTTADHGRSPDAGRAPGLPEALRPLAAAFHSQLSLASEEVRNWQVHHEAAVADPAGVLGAELGDFANGRIDTARLASLVGTESAPDPLLHHVMAQAADRFGGFVARGDDAFVVELPAGGDLRDAVRDALAEVGRAFAIGRAVEKARNHRYQPDDDFGLMRPWAFHRWSAAEKAAAPPLVVDLLGTDLRAAGLAEFLEGGCRIVLRVRGGSSPAPLARLVTPGVFVAQATGDAEAAYAGLVAHAGPGVVAVFEEGSGALPFVHDDAGGLEVDEGALTAALERVSSTRGQPGILDLRHLAGLVGTGVPGTGGRGGGAGGAPSGTESAPEVDRLAAWLLANLPDDA